MLTEQGVIEKAFPKKALVRIQKSSCCAQCDSRGACQVLSDREMLIEVANDLQAKAGDQVEISVPARSLLKLSMLIYLLPILALILGAYAGGALAPFYRLSSNLASVLGGMIALGVTFFGLIILDRAVRKRPDYYPRMTRILTRHVAGAESSLREPRTSGGI
jgi:sigma-E factor negative regulatory protein RseC